jgi:asparaginyl-tRNA synthetase
MLQVGQTLRVGGWVKTGREAGAGAFAFLEVNDGSCFDSLQVRGCGTQGCEGGEV